MKEEWDGLNQVQVSIQREAAILAVDMKYIEIQIYKVLQGEEEEIIFCMQEHVLRLCPLS